MKRKLLRAALAVCIVGVGQFEPSVASAGVAFSSSSTVKWTFDPNTAGLPNSFSLNVNPPPSSAGMPVPSSYQYSKTATSGSTSSVAKGSIGYVANSTTSTFTLAAGTGVTQSDPGNLWTGASSLRVDFDGFFNPTSPGYGPSVLGYVSVAVGGTVGTGGSAQFLGQVNFYNASTGGALRPTVNFSQTFSTAGVFAKTFTSSAFLNPASFAVGRNIRVKGYFEFRASNDEGPSDITPLDVDMGGAPPTATWYVDDGGDWSNPANWAAPPGSEIDDTRGTIPLVPNGVGQRARLANYFSGDREIALDVPVTVGALDVSTSSNLFINAGPASNLTFSTESGEATIQVRAVNGSSNQTLNTPVVLMNNLDVIVDGAHALAGSPGSAGALHFNQPISGLAGQGLRKLGEGIAHLNAPNQYTGGTTAAGGQLNANVPGSLGSGTVVANDGQLNYNALNAAATGIIVQAINHGQIDLGITPVSEHFSIGSLSAISGSGTQLSSLSVGSNLLLSQGAMIAHETFDVDPLFNNPVGLGNAPLYLFGIANDFAGGSLVISVGSNSGTPWRGFGSDRAARTFGSVGSLTAERIQVFGDADLVALHETLSINAQITGEATASLTKRGRGTVAINHPGLEFTGPITVAQGRLLVNGEAIGVPSVSVQPGATLGGSGFIGGSVLTQPGAILSPGGDAPNNLLGTLGVGSLHLDGAVLNFDMGAISDSIEVFTANAFTFGSIPSTINIIDTGELVPGTYALINYNGASLSNNGQLALGSSAIGNFTLSLVYNSVNTSIDLSVLAAISGAWTGNGSGDWSSAANWVGGVPDGIGHTATFGPAIAPSVINVSSARTLAAITFDSPQSYTLTGSTINLNTTAEDAQINVLSGAHTINVPLNLVRDLTVHTETGGALNVLPPMNSTARVITKTGGGMLSVSHLRAGALHLEGGVITIAPSATANQPSGTSVLGSLSVAPGASLDLSNNSLIIDYDVADDLVGQMRGHLQAARVMTSMGGFVARLGYGDNQVLGRETFAGLPVDSTSLLVKFTFAGDADLDGDVDTADLGTLASAWQTSNVWTGGDFDYSGFVDVADLGLLATNWQAGVGSPLGPSLSELLHGMGLPDVQVPEPAAISMLLASPLLLMRRRLQDR